jgi:Spy/CpxP family protein refolding chaperone
MTAAALGCVALMAVASVAAAQDERPRRERTRRFRDQVRGGRADQKARFDAAVDKLDLSDEQKAKVAKVREEYAGKFTAQAEKTKEAMEDLSKQMAEARKARDREKMSQLRQKQREAMAGSAELSREYAAAIKKLLTAEQVKKLEAAMLPPVPAGMLLATAARNAETLKLTEEQTAAVKKLAAEYAPPAEEQGGRRGRGQVDPEIRELWQKMRELRQSGGDKEELEKLQKQLREKMQARREKAEQRNKEIAEKLGKILTAEQMEKVQTMARERARAGRERRPRGDREGRPGRPRREGGAGNAADAPKGEGPGF